MGGNGKGVEVRERSIRLAFQWQGKTCRETLRTNGEPMPPTPANRRYAERLAVEIREKIRHGAFVYAEYFPASPHATTGHGVSVGDQLDTWLAVQVDKEVSTLKGYAAAVRWWKAKIGTESVKGLRYSAIMTALATEPGWSGKTRNNKVSVLRQALSMAVLDELIKTNPVDPIKAAPHQRPDPDPFSLEETEAILSDMRRHYSAQVCNYFEIKFFTGVRTSESLALKWGGIDWRRKQMVVSEAIVLGEFKDNTKTNTARAVQLNSRALAALKAQKEHTFMAGQWVFPDPKTSKRWTDDGTPRDTYWVPTLKRLGIRYRSPYQTRHTYATIMLMSGVTPAYAAKQMGHSIEQFLRTYSKWIDGGQNAVEMSKVEGLLSGPSGEILGEKTA